MIKVCLDTLKLTLSKQQRNVYLTAEHTHHALKCMKLQATIIIVIHVRAKGQ